MFERPKVDEEVETLFDFAILESALKTVGGWVHDVEIVGLTLPGGEGAKNWLASSTTAGIPKLHVQRFVIVTERGIPFSRSIIQLLVDWIVSMFLTTKLRSVELKPWVIVGWFERTKFENRISVATGGRVVVDFSHRMEIFD